MLKRLNLNGAVELTITELKSINGGDPTCPPPDTSAGCFSGPSHCPSYGYPTCVPKTPNI
ncbi:hypothetical protein Flavo103_23250 [Flavobacterium collinsii]|uniref:Uncharacterized protein n=1 Tax=Flavobacterium collinsii TaxID=1114861 RepID=A0ABM8KEQ3_9FLAO|nr:hypothetical protein Flavo103_23250 [Flavobacterium collinsii]CAA9195855.1 hypothetical protein FLACOL7796_00845 [Flavobacterium collinsii]